MNRAEPALGRRRCAGDGAPKARCALAASAQCLHESRRRVNMDLYEDGRCARHATFSTYQPREWTACVCMLMIQGRTKVAPQDA